MTVETFTLTGRPKHFDTTPIVRTPYIIYASPAVGVTEGGGPFLDTIEGTTDRDGYLGGPTGLPLVTLPDQRYRIRFPNHPEASSPWFDAPAAGDSLDLDDIIESDGATPGPVTALGKSAYDVAVDNGFVGNELAWLESLAGPPGEDGADGTGASASSTSTPGSSFAVSASHLGTVRTLTLNANITVTISATPPSSSTSDTATLILKQPASGGPYTWTAPAGLEWPDDAAAPSMPTTANSELVVELWWTGLAWRGSALRFNP